MKHIIRGITNTKGINLGYGTTMENAYLDDGQSTIILILDEINNEIVVSQIDVNVSVGVIDLDKYPVLFDGKLNNKNTIEDAKKLYGEPDKVYEENTVIQYQWDKSDTRKVRLVIITGLDPHNLDNISEIKADNN